MNFGRPLTALSALVVVASGSLALVACGGDARRDSGFEQPGAGSAGTPTGGEVAADPGQDQFGDKGDGGAAGTSTVCNPGPGNFEVPANNCDDDGDGQVDNVAKAACDSSLQIDGDATAFAKAVGLCNTATGPTDTSWGVISASYTQGYNKTAAPQVGQHGILGKFGATVKPREGGALGVLSSGWAREFDTGTSGATDIFQGGKKMSGGGAVPPGFPKPAGGCTQASTVYDVSAVKLQIKVPDNAQGISFDFDFYSGEWPEYVCTNYNDGFIAYLTSSAFNSGKADNISFDAQNNPVSVNNGFFDRCTPNTETGCAGGGFFSNPTTKTAACAGGEAELAGTGFFAKDSYCGSGDSTGGGATGWLTSTAPVKPGEVITIEFMIWDTGDTNFDSSVLLDHLTWLPTPTQTKTDRPK